MVSIACTRYNNSTWSENVEWRRQNNMLHGCIYGSPQQMAPCVQFNSWVFIIEMNNETNKIMGVGMVRNNTLPTCRRFQVYNDGNYNRYTYMGKRRIDRAELDENRHTRIIFEILDTLLFKGAWHSKRGGGITIFPKWILDIMRRQQKNNEFVLVRCFMALFGLKTAKTAKTAKTTKTTKILNIKKLISLTHNNILNNLNNLNN